MDKFKFKCICLWSKNDKYGFLGNINCEVHGKKEMEKIRKSIEVRETSGVRK